MFHKCVTLSLISSLLMMGCQAGSNERAFVRYDAAKQQMAIKAPYNGQYRLYRGTAMVATTQSSTPILTRTLTRGDLVGFIEEGHGRLLAVTRTERTTLNEPAAQASSTPAEYTWTVQPDAGQVDSVKTALLAVGTAAIVAAGFGIAVGISAAQSPWGIPTWP